MSLDKYLTTQLQENEELIAIVRRHGVVMLPGIMFSSLAILLDFFLLPWLFRQDIYGIIGFFIILIIASLVIVRTIYLWRMNALAITSMRIIDIDQRGLFERHVAEATYEKIQDVRYTIRGLWATLFSLGTVVVQTAGSTTNIDINGVYRPVATQRLIIDCQQKATGLKKPASNNTPILDIRRLKSQDS